MDFYHTTPIRLPMRHRWVSALLLLSAFVAFSSASAASASTVKWRLNGVPIAEAPVSAKWSGSLKLQDTNIPLLGSLAISCSTSGEGSVGTAAAGTVAAFSVTSCVNEHNCAGPVVEAINTRWNTELSGVGTVVHDKVVNGGSGAPGFKIRCTLTGTIDTCTGTIDTTTTNSPSGVSAAIQPTEKLNCSLSGTGNGVAEGSQTITATSGTLSAELETPPVWELNRQVLTSPFGDSWSGTVRISDTLHLFGGITVSCNATGKGTVGPASAGTLGSWSFTGCSSPQCGNANIEATDLSWNSEQFSGTGGREEQITSGGHGTPRFKVNCVTWGTHDECPLPLATMTNGEGTVTQAFKSEARTCSEGQAGQARIEGSQTISGEAGWLSLS